LAFNFCANAFPIPLLAPVTSAKGIGVVFKIQEKS